MRKRLLTVPALILAGILTVPTVARSEDPIFVPWTEIAPGLTAGYDPSSDNECKQGHENCVHSVIREMDRRFTNLADDCDHDAMFSLTYLRTTEEYHRFWHEDQFIEDNWLNHYDAVFGDYYFRASDDWDKGYTDRVPAAWKIAFGAADNREVTGMGNVILGMNAHINRDLPFVLAAIGMVAPDGTSRKADHDKVNEFLNRVSDAVFPELARRFDPTVDDSNIEGTTVDDFASFQIVPTWRETAWRNAERLVSASSESQRATVAQEIEDAAALMAESFRSQYSYSALSTFDADDRDAYCAVHHWDV